MFIKENNKLVYSFDSQLLWIEPWGNNSLRVRGTMSAKMPTKDWALLEHTNNSCTINITEEEAKIINGKIYATIQKDGRVTVYNSDDKILLNEYVRNYTSKGAPYVSPLVIDGREYKPRIGGDYELTLRLESQSRTEKIYGMGQYQQENLDLKGTELELSHRNSQASVPFCISDEGYGFLWNNPSVGRVTFGTNETKWYASSTDIMDYWVTAGDAPAEILENYAAVTGTVPMMPEWATGFWQSKLRYQTQDELLEVAREYKKRGIPLSVIIVDYFHWKKEGQWDYDERYWPDPEGMAKELEEMGTKLIVSVWPTVQEDSPNHKEMLEKGYLMKVERGVRYTMVFRANTIHFDATKPEARDFVWQKIKKNYYDKGVTSFWLDEAEPEMTVFHYDNYRYSIGSCLQIGNIYPAMYSKMLYDGMTECGEDKVLNLVRCAWAGSQRYGALLWSGDIDTTFESLRRQLAAGLNSGLAGLPWWTSDIGGFRHGDITDPDYRELFTRWFQWGTFCPVMRVHGVRFPTVTPHFDKEGIMIEGTGSPNEVWSYGEDVYEVAKRFIQVRELLKPYILEHMNHAHEKGTPIMRPLFYDFPNDKECWGMKQETEFMFGSDLLVAPVLFEKVSNMDIYLPSSNDWKDLWSGETFSGGQTINVKTPIDVIPVFVVSGSRSESLIGSV